MMSVMIAGQVMALKALKLSHILFFFFSKDEIKWLQIPHENVKCVEKRAALVIFMGRRSFSWAHPLSRFSVYILVLKVFVFLTVLQRIFCPEWHTNRLFQTETSVN